MIAPIGFDVSGFAPRQGSPAVDMAKAGLAAAADQNAITQRAIEGLMRQKMAREQLAFDREQLAEQGRQVDLMEGGRMSRQEAELQQAAYMDAMNRATKQRELESGIVSDATKAFGVGDMTSIEAAQQRAKIQAPSLNFQLPGSTLPPANEMGIADPFASPLAGLSISRGGETLYSGDTSEMRRRNQEAVKTAVGPLVGQEGGVQDPYLNAAINMAGVGGVSSTQALGTMLPLAEKASLRRQSGINSQRMSLSRNVANERAVAGMDEARLTHLHGAVEQIAQRFQGNTKLSAAIVDRDNAQKIKSMMADPSTWSQNMASFQLLKSNIKGAASDKDTARIEGAVGFLNQLEQKLNYYIGRNEIPAALKTEIEQGMQLVEAHNQRRIMQVGLEARNHVYGSPALMAKFNTPMEAAQFAVQAYHNVTQDYPTMEEIAAEAERIAPAFNQMKATRGVPGLGGGSGGGGGGFSVSAGGQLVDPAMLNSLGGLGVKPLPPKPKMNAPPNDDAAALELLNGGQ